MADVGRRARGAGRPLFLPTGKRIAYFSNRKGAEREGIWVMDADGANAAPLVVDDYQNVFPRWYADGQLCSSGRATRVWAVPATGSGAWRFRAGLPRSSCRGQWASGSTSIRRGASWARTRRDAESSRSEDETDASARGLRRQRVSMVSGRPQDRLHRAAGGLQAGLWVFDFQSAPRQVFSGWVVNIAWAGSEELIYKEGKPDLTALFWSVRPDGSARQRVPLDHPPGRLSWELSPTNTFDVSPDRRRIAVQAREQSEADIGMIENIR